MSKTSILDRIRDCNKETSQTFSPETTTSVLTYQQEGTTVSPIDDLQGKFPYFSPETTSSVLTYPQQGISSLKCHGTTTPIFCDDDKQVGTTSHQLRPPTVPITFSTPPHSLIKKHRCFKYKMLNLKPNKILSVGDRIRIKAPKKSSLNKETFTVRRFTKTKKFPLVLNNERKLGINDLIVKLYSTDDANAETFRIGSSWRPLHTFVLNKKGNNNPNTTQ
jgi:hypothetical protein